MDNKAKKLQPKFNMKIVKTNVKRDDKKILQNLRKIIEAKKRNK